MLYLSLRISVICLCALFCLTVTAHPVTVVSAASFERSSVAPESIASAFGTDLATATMAATDTDPATAGIQLPTQLAGTAVRIDGQLAELLFVSPTQINFIVPANVAYGFANIQVTSASGNSSAGVFQTRVVVPSLFTVNSNGQGVPAANLVRIRNGQRINESVSQFDPFSGKHVPQPIDPGLKGDRLFLELYCTGIRKTLNVTLAQDAMQVVLGGQVLTPTFAGKQPDFPGLDQINVELPQNLFGRGNVKLAVQGNKGALGPNVYIFQFTSNLVELEFGGARGNNNPQITSLSQTNMRVGETLIINGQGFSPRDRENMVRIGGVEAFIETSSPTQLVVRVPYGAASGPVFVRTPQGEGYSPGRVVITTSISGIVGTVSDPLIVSENYLPIGLLGMPLRDVRLKLVGTKLTATTTSEGAFTFSDVPAGDHIIEVDANDMPGGVTFPRIKIKAVAMAGQDTLLPSPIYLESEEGEEKSLVPSYLFLDGLFGGSFNTTMRLEAPIPSPVNVTNAADGGRILLRRIQLIPQVFSLSPVIQITPFDTRLGEGAKLILNVLEYSDPTIWAYRYDQSVGSPTFGEMVPVGDSPAKRTGIGQYELPISETGYYAFSERPPSLFSLRGRFAILRNPSEETVPIRNMYLGVGLTDGSGAAILRNFQNFQYTVNNYSSASSFFLRADGRVI